jgi:DNA-binding transcriptional regulator YiaG
MTRFTEEEEKEFEGKSKLTEWQLIGRKFRDIRKDMKLTQKQCAEKFGCGFTVEQISFIERGFTK